MRISDFVFSFKMDAGAHLSGMLEFECGGEIKVPEPQALIDLLKQVTRSHSLILPGITKLITWATGV